jgi:HPt (histidine-containing phosphotransfer) domain-containing protein
MNDYVTKPVTPQALAETLEKWLPKHYVPAEQRTKEWGPEKPAEDSIAEQSVWDKPSMLKRMMGDEVLVRTVLDCFLSDIPQQIQALRISLDAGDVPGAEQQAHSIKGASANIGGERLREAAFRIEKAASAGNLNDARSRMAELEAQFSRFRETMQRIDS